MRLRRSVSLLVVTLLLGTGVARLAQDPAVPRPPTNVGMPAAAPQTAPANEQGSAGSGALAGPGSAPEFAAPQATASVESTDSQPAAAAAGDIEQDADPPAVATQSGQVEVPASASGSLRGLELGPAPEAGPGRTVRFAVEVEDGIAVDAGDFAATVQRVLTDGRGWQGEDGVHFVPVSASELAHGARADLRVALATPDLTATLCAPLNTSISQVSCWNGQRAVLNLYRWLRGSVTYGADLASYRTYLINHEVGHGLGHAHAHCPGAGRAAPVMVQQTKSLEGCTAWPWPTAP